jgi:hypothetical protein
MTLVEAIKSGKRFKRPGHDWISPEDIEGIAFCTNDIIADYIIEETTIALTESQIREAYANTVKNNYASKEHLPPSLSYFINGMLKELGFK